ncbi:FecR family protein [Sphingobium cloacae]|uniref:Uncharacterized protein n=1 Tax=Sphingobium cloacae TaxID=120107 RepID=A0A1E1EYS2_9SPHN|nr:FecR family protein [Sphingobium cloacae]BAV63381.1 hypothetical protein SCLO_1003410 [Sphingobium cloacae]
MSSEEDPRIWDEALDWSIRMHGAKPDPNDQAELDAWIARSEAHARAWRKAQKTWKLMNAVPSVHATQPRAEAVRQHNSAHRKRTPTRRRLMLGGFAAAASATLVVMSPLGLPLRADQATATGEVRKITLADGSTVHLDTASAINVDYSRDSRRIALRTGQAFFDIAPNKARPFVVNAGGVDVTVVGTAFDVRLGHGAVDVAVQRGKVKIERKGAAEASFLTPGDHARIDAASGRLVRDHVPTSRIAPWRDGLIMVDGASVADVVAQLRRYHRGIIVLRGGDLGQKPVTGVYDIRDPTAALRAIVHPYGGEVTRITRYLLVVSAS